MAVAGASRQFLETRRTANVLAADHMNLAQAALERRAYGVLRADRETSQHDTLDEPWASAELEVSATRASGTGRLWDLHSRFNINDLALRTGSAAATGAGAPPAGAGAGGEVTVRQFRRLLLALELDPGLLQPLLDWLDADTEPRFPNGAEDEHYLGLDAPYRTANGPIGAVSELLLVKGFTPAILDTLAPYVSAERVSVPINVNTAPAELLMSLGPGIDESAAELVIRMRRTQPFQDPDAFRSHPALEGRLFDELEISTASEYFVLESRVGGGRLERRARSLLARSLPPSRFVLGRRLQGQHDG